MATGLTRENVRWAFEEPYSATGGPLTWLSHMLDVELFGLDAGAHHLVNVLLHTAASLILFAVLWSATGASPLSAVVAALFAVHPLHVESVAWVSERKDVLSGLFWFVTIAAYRPTFAGRVRGERTGCGEPDAWLALKTDDRDAPSRASPLDYWPLARLSWKSQASSAAG